ncbi:MAG TPA: aminoacyl-tRNA hydrolase [Methylomirabilota bacterium]|nr:aminoacyl-tRNA hydrolase [Methylomirabilota bacterium]
MHSLSLIAGLGNPGAEYARTRHNIGFLLADLLAERWKVNWKEERKFRARVGQGTLGERRLVLCEPLTYMNASGEAVASVRDFYKVPNSQLLVLVDDADLPFGALRLRGDGSTGGHHGLESVESHLGTRQYARLRLGIGRRDQTVRDIHDHVLGRFSADEMPALTKILDRAANQVECWLNEGLAKAMSLYNGLAI